MTEKVNYKFNKDQQKNWFPYTISTKPDDFILQNGVHGRCPHVICDDSCNQHNPLYWKNLQIEDVVQGPVEIGCFGCSYTYGVFLKESDTWPSLLQQSVLRQTGNFGLPGGGADACLINLTNAYNHYKIKTAIILFPLMDRRLLKFKSKDLFFQMPIQSYSEWPFDELVSQNYFDKTFITEQIKNIKKEITLDVNNTYTKEKILQTKHFCEKNGITLFAGSWNRETESFLKKNNFNLLPFYDISVSDDRAIDTQHPCRTQNLDWISKIETSIL
jgi:hypothetical protein